jgi:hypothetical protein
MIESKWCGGCECDLPITSFNKNAARRDGLQGACRICQCEATKRHYRKNKQPYLDRAGNHEIKLRAFVHSYLVSNPCVDCGFADTRALEFDHVRGVKKDTISNLCDMARVCNGCSMRSPNAKCGAQTATVSVMLKNVRLVSRSKNMRL